VAMVAIQECRLPIGSKMPSCPTLRRRIHFQVARPAGSSGPSGKKAKSALLRLTLGDYRNGHHDGPIGVFCRDFGFSGAYAFNAALGRNLGHRGVV
jgi:hypothetical protein